MKLTPIPAVTATLLGVFVLGSASAQWPVSEFEIFEGVPATSADVLEDMPFIGTLSVENFIRNYREWVDLDEPRVPPVPLPAAAKAEIESYLREAALALGTDFAAPLLEPVVENAAGNAAFRVYYHDLGPDRPPARYRNSNCNRVRPFIELNARKFLSGGTVPDKHYQDLGHELFHAVQQSYALFRNNCEADVGEWISEGTAQAVGADLAAFSSRKIDDRRRTGEWLVYRWGLRRYDETLWVARNDDAREDEGYAASSFWRYIGEYVAQAGGAGTAVVKPDYRYLIPYFESSLGGAPSERVEMSWIHARLKGSDTSDRSKDGSIGIGLDRLYPQFLATFAAYMNTRITPASPAIAGDGWLEFMFPSTRCREIRLNDDFPVYRTTLEIDKFAGSCYRISLAYSEITHVQVAVSGADKAALEALTIATERGQVVAKPTMIELASAWQATWIFNVSPSVEPAVFVIANVAEDPAATVDLSVQIEFGPSTWTSSMIQGPMLPSPTTLAPPATQPAPPPAPPEADGARVTAATQAARVGAQIEEGLTGLSSKLVNGTGFSRTPAEPPCEDPFVTEPCGPATSISLSLVPGIYGSLSHSSGRGGVFGQFAAALLGHAETGLLNSLEVLRPAAELADSIDGSSVNIVIPLIDHGFSGSFANAWLRVSRRDGGEYLAIGPQDILQGPGVAFPLAGRVTIEEYTPTLVRGTFAGDLVDMDRVELVGDDPTLPVHETIAGTFQIVAPWRGDERVTVLEAGDPFDNVVQDLRQLLPGLTIDGELDEAIRDAREAYDADAERRATGGYIAPACDCSCNRASSPVQECAPMCAGTFAACGGMRATALLPPELVLTVVEADTGEPFLRSLPPACELMDEGAGASVLEAAQVATQGAVEWLAKVTSQCGWADRSQRSRSVALNLLFAGLDLYDSRNEPVEALRLKVAGFRFAGSAMTDVEGIGNVAFGMHDRDATHLTVLTGIYGTAIEDDSLTTELVASYSLVDGTRGPEARLAALIAMARPQIELLERRARTTHEGSAD